MSHLKRIPRTLILLSLLSGGALAAQPLVTTVSCPFGGAANSAVFNGIYVTGYTGNNLSQVTLAYGASAAQQYGITLTAHRNAFNGPIIGTPQTATVNLPATGEVKVTFDFGGAPVTPGDTIAFTQTFAIYGPVGALVFFDDGTGSGCAGVFETTDTQPPLSTIVPNGGAGLIINETTLVTQYCVPSDTVLCLDDTPGDQRFKVTASFHTAQAGGISGTGQAVPLAPLGTLHGGLFWFFSPDNPEMLVKILNGCSTTDHFWAYISAGTNVAFTVTVEDTALANVQKTYTNPDRTPALPIQDTLALASCHDCTQDSDCRPGLLCCFFPAGRKACVPPVNGVCQLVP
jgi:hypothetical protein